MKRLLSKNEFYLFAILLAVCVTIGAINNTFFAAGNIVDLFRTATPYGIFAVGIMMVVVSGGIDISFPAIRHTQHLCHTFDTDQQQHPRQLAAVLYYFLRYWLYSWLDKRCVYCIL